MGKSKVGVVRTTPESVLDDVDHLCDLANLASSLKPNSLTILKDGGVWHQPFPGTNTTPWQLEGTVLALKRRGFENLSLVRGRGAALAALQHDDKSHTAPLCERYNVPVLYNFKHRDMRWIDYRPRARLHVLHEIFRSGVRLPDYYFGKNMLHLPALGWDEAAITSGAMYNAFGAMLNHKRDQARCSLHRTLVDLLAIQREIQCGLFAVLDGTTAGSVTGSRSLIPVTKNILLASNDLVAIDAVAAKLMGFDPMSIEYLRVAHEDGLGVADPRDIELSGSDIGHESWQFGAGREPGTLLRLWRSERLEGVRRRFWGTPLAGLGRISRSVARARSRRAERARFEEWRRTTPWGQLFEAYALGQSHRILKGNQRRLPLGV